MDILKKYAGPLLMPAIFETITVTLWLIRDNRAFCKYLCPTTVFLKPMRFFCCCDGGL